DKCRPADLRSPGEVRQQNRKHEHESKCAGHGQRLYVTKPEAGTDRSDYHRANSDAISTKRSSRPSAPRYSMVTVRFSIPTEAAQPLHESVSRPLKTSR